MLAALPLTGCPSNGPEPSPAAETGSTDTGTTPEPDPPASGSADSTTAGDGSSSDDGTKPPELEPGPDVVITAFDQAHVYFSGWEEGQNFRSIDTDVEFPSADLGYENIGLYITLRCPDGGCDFWDRFATLGIVENAGTDDERVIEVARFITPYRVEGGWGIDVSRLRPLLTGPQTLRVHIDTWVGPGHAQGAGWLVDARFEFFGGVPSPRPVEVIPVWTRNDFEIGCPSCDVAKALPPQMIEIREDATRVDLVTVITGHGQGNLNNCAEFCQLEHTLSAGGDTHAQTIWRDDCDQNPISGQQGTWTLSRAGWCPGDDVDPWVQDITPAKGTTSIDVSYALDGYSNTCHPESPVCEGCALGTGCDFDGGNHTAPQIKLSSLAVVYVD